MSGDARADRIDVAVDLGIVCRLIAGEVAVGEETHDQQNNHGDHDRDAKAGTLGARRPGVKVLFGGRQRLGRGFRLIDWRAFSALAGGLCVRLFHTLLIAFQISPDALFGIADGVRQFDLREIMSIKTLNITLVGAGNRFLRLHNLQIIGNAGGKSILRLRQRLLGQSTELRATSTCSAAAFNRAAPCGLHNRFCRGDHPVANAPASAWNPLRARRSEPGCRRRWECSLPPFTCQVPFDWPGVTPMSPRFASTSSSRIMPGGGGPARKFGAADLRQGCLIVGAPGVRALQIGVERKRRPGPGTELSRSGQIAGPERSPMMRATFNLVWRDRCGRQ